MVDFEADKCHKQTRQTVRTTISPALPSASDPNPKVVVERKLNVIQTIMHIIRTDGFRAFFHGLGPALILVSNPILQFTVRLSLVTNQKNCDTDS